MRKRAKTALAFLLALSCICSTVVSAENLRGEAVQSKSVQSELVLPESGKAVSEEAEEGKASSEEAESGKTAVIGESTVEESEDAFQQEKEISGVLVTVKADSGVFPTGAKLQVKKVGKAAEQKVDNALKEKLLENQENLLQSMVFDISVLDQDGEEVQPDTTKGEVKVQFSHIPFLEENAEKQISVFHLDSVDATAEKLATEKIEEKENAVEVSAEHFSLFAVSLVKKENSFSDTVAVELGETISLYKLLRQDVLRCEAMKETDPAVVRLKHDGDGQVAIEALHEGTARLLITIKDELGEEKKEYRIIVQKASLSGRAGKEMEYSLTGFGNDMTLTLRGRGETDAFELAPWEPYRDKIRRVIIGEGIEKLNVEMEAFGSMEHLETVSLPSTLTEIPDHAFYHSENLGDVTIPASVRRIGEKAFYKSKGNGKKNTIINHSSVFISEKGSMQYNPAFTSVQQTAGEEEEVKKWNISMKNVQFYTLPEIHKCFFELETEGNEYANFYLYTTEDPSEAVTVKNFTDNSGSFKRDLRLFFFSSGNGWRLPGTNKTFTSYLFDLKDTGLFSFLPGHTYYCTFLMNPGGSTKPYSETQLLQKVITVSDEARLPRSDGNFSWQLTGEKKPYTLTIEGSGRMQGLTANGELRSWNKLLHALGRQAHLELKGNITALDSHALEGVTYIKKGLVLPDSIVEIGDSVFSKKSIEGNLVFPKNLKKIGNSAFRNLSYKGDLSLPEGLESIGESAFRDLKETNAITIPASVTAIGTGAFYKDRMSFKGKNSIENHSSVKLGSRYVNPLFTDYTPDDSREAPIPSYSGSGRGGSGRGGSSGGSGGSGRGSSAGGNGGTPMVLGADRNMPSNVNWQRDAKGWWILNPDGSYPKSQWLWINNRWYYFNLEGYMQTGWLFYNNAWYYFEEGEGSEQGKMCIGWKEIRGFWYYFSEEVGAENGKMCTGWQEVQKKWYYLNPASGQDNGKMLANTKVDGYSLGTDGAWRTEIKKAV